MMKTDRPEGIGVDFTTWLTTALTKRGVLEQVLFDNTAKTFRLSGLLR